MTRRRFFASRMPPKTQPVRPAPIRRTAVEPEPDRRSAIREVVVDGETFSVMWDGNVHRKVEAL